jgi:hypothetical protein
LHQIKAVLIAAGYFKRIRVGVRFWMRLCTSNFDLTRYATAFAGH